LMRLSIGGMLIWSISLTIRLQHSGSKTNVQTICHSRHSTMYVSTKIRTLTDYLPLACSPAMR
jgi:hypothetical protein